MSALLNQGDPFNKRFAVFPLAPVSACIATGYALTNRPKVRVFQHHHHAYVDRIHAKMIVEALPDLTRIKRCATFVRFAVKATGKKP